MVEMPVAKGLLASNVVGPTLLGLAAIGGAYYLYKRYGKKSDEQVAEEGEVVEQAEAAAEATPA